MMPFPILLDADGRIRDTFGVKSWPTTILFDPDGKLVDEIGPDDLEKKLKPIPLAVYLPRQLDRRITAYFDNSSLKDAIGSLRLWNRAPVEFDREALRSLGVSEETKVPLKLGGPLSLRSALALLLDPVGLAVTIGPKGYLITRKPPVAPSAPAPPSVLQARAAERIARKLKESKVSYRFDKRSLSKFAEFFEEQSGENVVLDPKGRMQGKIDPATPVIGSGKDVPMGEALEKLLSPLGLRAVVRDEVIVIEGSGQGQELKSPAERLLMLKQGVDDAEAAYVRATKNYEAAYDRAAKNDKEGDPAEGIEKLWSDYTRKVDEDVPKGLELVRKDPRSQAAFSFLNWIGSNPRTVVRSKPYVKQAVELLLAYHAENPNLGRLCSVLGYMGHELYEHEPTLKFLRTTAEKNPDRTTRGQATLALARLTYRKGRGLEYEKKDDWRRVYQEAERLFDSVVEKYADYPDLLGGDRVRQRTLGEEAKAQLFEIRHLAIGKTVPEIAGEDIDGQPLRLGDHRGKVVVLVFWATWCGPCMAMVPHERSLVERMKGKRFVLLGVNGDKDRDAVKASVKSNRITWRSFWNGGPDGPITDTWNVQGWPTTYVLDAKGLIRFKDVREKEMDEAVDLLVKELEEGRKSDKD